MEQAFWLERWELKQTGFHQDGINPYLREYWQCCDGAVFVPLCGKSLDMKWLREQGQQVLGVELSPIAAAAFFDECGMVPRRDSIANFERFEADRIRILCGDFFDLDREQMAQVGAVYDRAALVALPRQMRADYARHLANILPPSTKMLLITFDYPQQQMAGPPFAVPASEVEELYGEFAQVRLLSQTDALQDNPRFAERGLARLLENVFLIEFKRKYP